MAIINIAIITDETIRLVFLLYILNIILPPFCVQHTLLPGIDFCRAITLFIERILYMKLPFFASFIVFCIWLTYQLKRQQKKETNASESYWAREAAANNTRKKPLDDVEFITIPFEFLPMDTLKEDSAIAECQKTLSSLSDQQIVNFTGLTNTDLKLQYGVANLPFLSDCDQRYTLLARTLQKWASLLYEKGYTEEAKSILPMHCSRKFTKKPDKLIKLKVCFKLQKV